MGGDPIVSPPVAGEGSPNLSIHEDTEDLSISIQADAGISTQADEDEGIFKDIRADEGKPSISSQADDKEQRSFSFHADEGTPLSVSVHEDGSNPSISSNVGVFTHAHLAISANSGSGSCHTEVFQLDISAQADLTVDSVQETVDSLEKVQESDVVEAVHASNSLLNLNDVAMGDGDTAEGKPINNLPEETFGAIGKLEDVPPAFENPSHDNQAHDDSNEEFISVGDLDESGAADKQTIVDDGDTCNGGESDIPMQEDGPWNEGSTDAFATTPEPQDANRRSSLKRSRSSSSYDNTPCVQVTYRCLTSESKNKLKELLQKWAQWHGEFVGIEVAEKGPLESGDETYFPPLQVGGQSKATMSFWMDKPSKQARTENAVGDSTPASQAREKEVPLYDRAGTGALISQETEMSLERGLDYVDEGSRCFNCGSYSHSLKDCPRPRDNNAINNARKLLAEKRGSANGSRTASRYYQNSPGGKFDDLKPGFLGSETRQLLGIGELDPPPWLNRMRELGYPPGYLEDQEEEQSGITIFGTSDDAEGSFIGEDGEILGENKKRKSTGKKMVVHFPGVNGPIPDDADRRTWGSPADFGSHDRAPHRTSGRSTHTSSFSAAAVTSDGTVYTGTEDWEGPPGGSRDSYSRSSKTVSPGFEGASYNNSSPWQPHEQSWPGKVPPGRSPHLGRSSSDSGRRSPKVGYDEPHSLPPLGALYSRQSPLHNSRSYQSPSTPSQRFPYSQQSREDESRRRAWSQAHDALQSMHRSDRPSPARRR